MDQENILQFIPVDATEAQAAAKALWEVITAEGLEPTRETAKALLAAAKAKRPLRGVDLEALKEVEDALYYGRFVA